MLVLGLTGGIASGKTKVAEMFEELGAFRIDADLLAREVVEPGQPAWQAVVDYFGPFIIQDDGRLNRKKLAAVVFSNEEKRLALNKIVHPPVIALIRSELARARDKDVCVALVEVPLLYEVGLDHDVDRVVVVAVSEAVQLSRLINRDGLSDPEARQRIVAQMPLSEKVDRADYVIYNNGSLAETKEQVENLWQALSRECIHEANR